MSKIRVSVVSYLNSKVFVKGLLTEADDLFDISLDVPSDCAQKLIHHKVDIGLIPVAVIPEINSAHIISDYCISAHGAVNSVFLFSNSPLKDIHTIYLDPHSRTSNLLTKTLAHQFWGIKAEYKNRTENIPDLKEGEGFVLIGDRTFPLIDKYSTCLDLASEWYQFTRLPFVFAAWVSNKEIAPQLLLKFNEYLANGINCLEEVIAENSMDGFDVADYLTNKINYQLNEEKRKAIQIFLEKSELYR